MGAPPLDLDDTEPHAHRRGSARAGVVMLVPFSERLDEERIEPEEIDALVAEFKYVQALPQVDPERVGFFGASVGGSLALVAAADPRIAEDVDHVVSFGGYYDALSAFGAIATHRIHTTSGRGVDAAAPRGGGDGATAHQPHRRRARPRAAHAGVPRPRSKQTEELASLGPVGRSSYDFLANRRPGAGRRT